MDITTNEQYVWVVPQKPTYHVQPVKTLLTAVNIFLLDYTLVELHILCRATSHHISIPFNPWIDINIIVLLIQQVFLLFIFFRNRNSEDYLT